MSRFQITEINKLLEFGIHVGFRGINLSVEGVGFNAVLAARVVGFEDGAEGAEGIREADALGFDEAVVAV